MQWLVFLLLFFIGASWGAFLYVVCLRLPKKQDFIRTRSECTMCAKKLALWETLPVISYIILLGKCRHCKKPISWHYVAAEVAMGLLFIAGWHMYGLTWEVALFFFSISILFLLFFIDLYTGWVYEMIVLPSIVFVFAVQLVLGNDPALYLLGLVIGIFVFLVQYVLSRGTWIGKGDIRIGAFMGVILGWKVLFVALAISYIIGGLVAMYLLLTQRKERGDTIPFGPFLVLGTLAAMLWGPAILDWYLGLIGYPFW